MVDTPKISAVATAPRLLDRLRVCIRAKHYSLRTEEAYVFWCRAFIRYHGLRHPAQMGRPEVEAYLTHLAAERGLSPSSHAQALSALLFLYGQVLGQQLPWMSEIGRPGRPQPVGRAGVGLIGPAQQARPPPRRISHRAQILAPGFLCPHRPRLAAFVGRQPDQVKRSQPFANALHNASALFLELRDGNF